MSVAGLTCIGNATIQNSTPLNSSARLTVRVWLMIVVACCSSTCAARCGMSATWTSAQQQAAPNVGDSSTKDDTDASSRSKAPDRISSDTELLEKAIDLDLKKIETLADKDNQDLISAKETFQAAKLNLAQAAESKTKTQDLRTEIDSLPETLRSRRELLSKTDTQTAVTNLTDQSVEELERRLASLETQKQQTAEKIKQLTPASIQVQIKSLQDELKLVADSLADAQRSGNAGPSSSNEFVIRAFRAKWDSESQKQAAESDLLKAQIEKLEAFSEVQSIDLELAQMENKRIEAERSKITEAINLRRQQDAVRLEREAITDKQAVGLPLKEFATYNVKLTQKVAELTTEIATLGQQTSLIDDEVDRVTQEQQVMEKRLKVVGFSDSFGRVLQDSRNQLLESRAAYLSINQVATQITQSQVAKFYWQDELTLLEDSSSIGENLAQAYQAKSPVPEGELRKLSDSAAELVDARKEILSKLISLEDKKRKQLTTSQSSQLRLEDAIDRYMTLIDEKILWVRNAPVIGSTDVGDVIVTAGRLVALDNWKSVLHSIRRSIGSHLFQSLLAILVPVALLLFRPRILGSLQAAGQVAGKRACRNFGVTVSSFLHTSLLALVTTSPLLAIGWLLRIDQSASGFASGLGRALVWAFVTVYPFEFLRQCCRERGLATSHFSWTEASQNLLKKNLWWLLLIAIPVIVLLTWLPALGARSSVAGPLAAAQHAQAADIEKMLEGQGLVIPDQIFAETDGGQIFADVDTFSIAESWNRFGRLMLLGLLIATVVFSVRVFSPNNGFDAGFDPAGSIAGMSRARILYAAYLMVIAVPVALGVIASIGYYYSAIRIGQSLVHTIILVIMTAVLYSTAVRFLLIRRRNLRYEQLLQQREQAKIASEQQEVLATPDGSELIEIDLQNEPGLDMADVSRQARELTKVIFIFSATVCLLSVWSYLLPATKIMDHWELWAVDVNGQSESVTLRNVLFSAVMFAVTYFGVRNMPGMLELLLLQRLPLDAGARYAVTSIFRYVLLVAGGIIALGYLKIPWSNYSWLVAAISVGLGFGLQEIVANFVSGLILLLERPVRVGDVVTIDGTTGIVSKIQMRATTVTNWDNQELVVPNKDLITGKLLNWTLSSVVNRISLKFGVAYGTDPALVRKIALDAISSNEALLQEPPPMVTFEEFGDSSLNFTLRCCVSRINLRWLIIHDLNIAIEKALRENNIEVPFPQLDLHVVSNIAEKS